MLNDAMNFAHRFGKDVNVLALPPSLVTALRNEGCHTIGAARDRLINGRAKIPGVGAEKRGQICAALNVFGAWPEEHPAMTSYGIVAMRAHQIGLNEGKAAGKADAEKAALHQKVKFEVDGKVSLDKLKNMLLGALEDGNRFMQMSVAFEYHVPAIGPMFCQAKIIMQVSALSKMVRMWAPGASKPISGDCIALIGEVPRECEFLFDLDSFSGTMELKPPDREALARFEKAEKPAAAERK